MTDANGREIRRGDWVVIHAGKGWTRKAHRVVGITVDDRDQFNRIKLWCGCRKASPSSLMVLTEEQIRDRNGSQCSECCERIEMVARRTGLDMQMIIGKRMEG